VSGGAHKLTRWLERSWALPLILTLVIYALTAAGRPIIDADEGVYAHIPQQMIERGDWLTPYVNSVRSFDKPPLLYWLIAICYSIFGVAEFAARIPSILAVFGITWIVQRLAARGVGPRAGTAAAFAFSFSAGAFLFTLEVMHDVLLIFFLTLTMYCFVLVLERSGPWPVLGFFAASAGAFLAKGLVGVAFPFGIAILYMLAAREAPRIRSGWLFVGALLFCALALPWHVAMEVTNPGFLRIHFFEEQVLRFFSRREPVDYDSVPLLLFWALLPVWFFPWSAFLPAAFRLKRDRITMLATIWCALILVFFSLSSRLEHYAFPLLPPLAVLVGRALATDSRGVRTGYRILAGVGILLLVLAVGLAGILVTGYGLPSGSAGHADRTYNNDFSIMLEFPADLIRQLLPPAIAATLALGLGLLAAQRFGFSAVVVAMLAFHFSAAYSLRVCEDVVSSKSFGQILAAEARSGDKVVILGDYESANSISFYAPIQLAVCDGTAAILGPGLRYPDAPELVLTEGDLLRLWRSDTRTFVLAEESRLAALGFEAVHPVASHRDRILAVNQPPASP